MPAGAPIIVNAELIDAYRAASSPHSIRALKSDLAAFDGWCRRRNRVALLTTPETIPDDLDGRAGLGARPAPGFFGSTGTYCRGGCSPARRRPPDAIVMRSALA